MSRRKQIASTANMAQVGRVRIRKYQLQPHRTMTCGRTSFHPGGGICGWRKTATDLRGDTRSFLGRRVLQKRNQRRLEEFVTGDDLAFLENGVAVLEGPLAHAPPQIDPTLMAGEVQSNTSEAEFNAMVIKAKEYIVAGDVFQVVLSQRFTSRFDLPAFSLYRALRRVNPSPYLFFLEFGGFAIAGSSPELMVKARDGTVTIRPIAGTRPRGATPHEDQALETELLADPKERAEHLMLLDLGRNDVGRVAEIGSVTVTDQFFIERYSQVMHIVSNVEGRLRGDRDALDALAAGFPAGTVSGAPKVRAMQIIDELEKEKRSLYAGCVGYFSAGADMDTCIVLRTALIKDGTMYVQAGAGIVADSDPQFEQQECINKAKALFRAAEEAKRFASAVRRGQ